MPPTTDFEAALFETLRSRLTAISCRIVGSRAEAEDIVQDCFLKWHDAQREALTTPAAWLTTVVQHQSIDRLRKRGREAVAVHTAMELAPQVPPALPEDGLLLRAELEQALARLARLSAAERVALVLHEVFDCDHAAIAAALGTRAVNARQYLARARRRLAAGPADPAPDEKLCRELIRRFQAALDAHDVPAMLMLLADEQPVSVRACANDAVYRLDLVA